VLFSCCRSSQIYYVRPIVVVTSRCNTKHSYIQYYKIYFLFLPVSAVAIALNASFRYSVSGFDSYSHSENFLLLKV
jgi:hypothetical protein